MKNLKEIISQLDTVTPCVLNPLFLRHKSSGPFACIHPSDHQVVDEKGCYGHANNVYYGRNPWGNSEANKSYPICTKTK